MKKKYIAILTTMTMLSFVQELPAPDCCYAGGNCYQECRTAPCVGPAVALAAIALAAIIAVALIHSGHSHASH